MKDLFLAMLILFTLFIIEIIAFKNLTIPPYSVSDMVADLLSDDFFVVGTTAYDFDGQSLGKSRNYGAYIIRFQGKDGNFTRLWSRIYATTLDRLSGPLVTQDCLSGDLFVSWVDDNYQAFVCRYTRDGNRVFCGNKVSGTLNKLIYLNDTGIVLAVNVAPSYGDNILVTFSGMDGSVVESSWNQITNVQDVFYSQERNLVFLATNFDILVAKPNGDIITRFSPGLGYTPNLISYCNLTNDIYITSITSQGHALSTYSDAGNFKFTRQFGLSDSAFTVSVMNIASDTGDIFVAGTAQQTTIGHFPNYIAWFQVFNKFGRGTGIYYEGNINGSFGINSILFVPSLHSTFIAVNVVAYESAYLLIYPSVVEQDTATSIFTSRSHILRSSSAMASLTQGQGDLFIPVTTTTKSINNLFIIAAVGLLVGLILLTIIFYRHKIKNSSEGIEQGKLNEQPQSTYENGLTGYGSIATNLLGDELSTSMSTNSSLIQTTYYGNKQGKAFIMFNLDLALPGYLQVNSSDFSLKSQLAKGGGGQVFFAEPLSSNLKSFGTLIVVKIVAKNYLELEPTYQEFFNQEVGILHYLQQSQNIVKFIGFCHEPCSILFKNYPLGSLDRWIYKVYPFKKVWVNTFLKDIAIGLLSTHNSFIAHCDIKPQNILIDDIQGNRLKAVITDFGIANVLNQDILSVKAFKVSNIRGLSLNYAAPEVYVRMKRKLPDSPQVMMASDIYSFSMVLHEILSKRVPWT